MFGFSSYASANVPKLSSAIDGLHIVTINDYPVAPVEASTDEPVLNCDRDLPVNPEGKASNRLQCQLSGVVIKGRF